MAKPRNQPKWRVGACVLLDICGEQFYTASRQECWMVVNRLMELVEQALAHDQTHKHNVLLHQARMRLVLNGHAMDGNRRVLAERFYASALTTLALGAQLVNALYDDKHIRTEHAH